MARHGFSLIELMLVLLLMGILLAVAVPLGERSVARFNLTGAARQMAADIRMHQQVAISSEDDLSTYQIIFDPSKHRYQLQKNTLIMKTINLPGTVHITNTNFPGQNNRLRFSIQGRPIDGGGTITLLDQVTGELYYVIVAAITGRVRISTEPPAAGELW
jgi:prepilin-type N-terminal cleavage/methylation domain-containing protein